MRLGVLDVGSNTVHLLVVDAHRGARPTPAYSEKAVLRLAELIDREGRLSADGEHALTERVESAATAASRLGCDDLLAFATSAVRDARNGEKVLARIRNRTGVDLQVLDGDDEARLTFLAVRRWFGWSSGRLLSLDIGGGSLELASGVDEEPDVALSLPLGAGRLTRERLIGDPPSKAELTDLRAYAEEHLGKAVAALSEAGRPDRAVASSKTFRSLARLTGAAPSAEGMYARRVLRLGALQQVLAFISRIPADDLAELEGVSTARAHQLLAGGVVAEAAMRMLDVDAVEICPWALREGVILRRLDWLDAQ
ncbi:MAG TPA: Ppx/GppA phosphatase family protein [Mycobacteriales bacterium]|jgi:exopolyphosphatase/guanosine-5'-triphosphate,3'-diphosphate pyrophosphatase|nr:exopolyphosphatase [Cryptosporangiaceae bacterium]MDQ1677081.1 exopolyphosphatase / guanosine-5-triphosphate,3-diphosphate pyrophosphatase [Actinomycetota bacterium]HEV7757155.1 Ppx/GppA phosphatase family protein [Mycobacteriales bacterium]